MNVLIVGPGAVGSYLGSILSLSGNEVAVVARESQARALRSGGLHLRRGGKVQTAEPTEVFTSVPEAFEGDAFYDLMIVATKAYDAPPVLEQLPSSESPLPRKVMTVQNGIGVEETASQLLGPTRVLAAALTVPVSLAEPGSAVVERGGGIGLAPIRPGESIDVWVGLFQKAGLKVRGYDDYEAMKWSKLFLNLPGNATSAILARKPGIIYRHYVTFNLEMAMLNEVLDVMDEKGIPLVDLPGGPARLLALALSRLPPDWAQRLLRPVIERARGNKAPSLYLDLAAGKPQSEVVSMNGAVVQLGRELGIPTPVNRVLTDTLFRLHNGLLVWEDFQGRPDVLLARVREG